MVCGLQLIMGLRWVVCCLVVRKPPLMKSLCVTGDTPPFCVKGFRLSDFRSPDCVVAFANHDLYVSVFELLRELEL